MHPLLQKQEELHAEAARLLNEVVFPIVQQYGTVTVGGSYLYKLLSYPDIDIDIVYTDLVKEMYVTLCKEFLSHDAVSSLKTADRVTYPHAHNSGRPMGYWLAPGIHYGGNVWNIDIWLQKPEWYTGDTARFAVQCATLNDEKRITVLSLKEELRKQGIYGIGKEFQSVDVYEAVINADAETMENLRQYKQLKQL